MQINRTRVQFQDYYGANIVARADVASGATRAVKRKKGGHRLVGIKGFGIDLNGDGRVRAADDGFLAFKGKNGDYNIQHANRLLKSFAGDFDLNGDNKITRKEKQRGRALRKAAAKLDLDGDSVLSNWELKKAGAVVVRNPGNFGAQIEELALPTEKPEQPTQNAANYQPIHERAPQHFAWQPYSGPFGYQAPPMNASWAFTFNAINQFLAAWPFLF